MQNLNVKIIHVIKKMNTWMQLIIQPLVALIVFFVHKNVIKFYYFEIWNFINYKHVRIQNLNVPNAINSYSLID